MLVELGGDTPVEIAGDPRSGWYPVKVAGFDGWVAGSRLEGAGIPEIAQLCATTTALASTKEQANVRDAPSCNAVVVTRLNAGTDVALSGEPQSGWYPVTAGGIEGWISGSLLSGSGIPAIGSLCGSNAESGVPATGAPEPIGSVRIYGPEGGGDYGQSFPDGNCSNWLLRIVNRSDTAISGFTFVSLGADYVDGYDNSSTEIIANTPEPVRVEAFVAAGTEQSVDFQACTSTPVPGSDFELGVTPDSSVTYHWVTGYNGVSEFGW